MLVPTPMLPKAPDSDCITAIATITMLNLNPHLEQDSISITIIAMLFLLKNLNNLLLRFIISINCKNRHIKEIILK